MIRIDKYLSNLGYGSRKDVVKLIKDGLVEVNDNLVISPDYKIEWGDDLRIGEEEFEAKEFVYIALHKPADYLSSNKPEAKYQSYRSLLDDCPYVNLLSPVGRLDVDTEGLLLLTNDGDFTHKLISPKKDIYKKYYVKIEKALNKKDIEKLENGLKIDEFITKPAILETISDDEIYLSISEGKFHQIKKMLEAVDNKVVYLKRVSIGEYELGDLKLGEWKYL
ncbi:MAG: pseudouridine synthase [Candidatus Gracilibacteria bacterium]|nr:pseudouridine synthase [Candidatus Gracilibacteria bacterium]